MSPTTQTELVVIPDDVKRFAIERGADALLPAVLEAARKNFPKGMIRLVLEEDYEMEGLWQIVVFVRGDGMDVEGFLAAKDEYNRALFAAMPAPLVCLFRFGME